MESCCRACSRSDDFRRFSLYAVAEVSQEVIANMIRDTSDTQVSTEDGLPQQICPDCLMTLSLAYSFRKQCRRSDAKFREYWGGRTPSQSVDQQQHQQQQQQQSQQHQLPRRSQSQIPEESSFEAVATTIKEEVDIYDYEYSVPAGHDNQWVIQNPRTIGEGAMTVVHNTGGHYYDEGAASETGAAPDRDGHGMLHPMDDAAEMGESSGLGQKDDKLKKNVPNPERYSQRIRRQMSPKPIATPTCHAPDVPVRSSERRKEVKHRYRTWTKQQMTNALAAMRAGMSDRKASTRFNIPRRTLRDMVNRCGVKSRSAWLQVDPLTTETSTSTNESTGTQQAAAPVKDTQDSVSPAIVGRPKNKRWTESNMSCALKAIQEGMRFSDAAAMFHIPVISIYNRAKRCGVTRPKGSSPKGILKGSKKWTPEQMNNALKAVKEGMVLSTAATYYNIPQPTLWTYARRFGISQRDGTTFLDDTEDSDNVNLSDVLNMKSQSVTPFQ